MQGRLSYPGKRVFDLLIVTLVAVPAAVLTAACAAAIKLDDGGPVMFRQHRVGRAGVGFEVLKLRTMRQEEGGQLFPDAARITRAGRVLRRLSLDELPQIVNVARGEMSIVGPRPTLAYQVARYTPDQRRRLQVRPGLTGLAQVKGRNNLPWTDRIVLDLQYLEHQSVRQDLAILAASVRVVLSADVEGHPMDDPLARHD